MINSVINRFKRQRSSPGSISGGDGDGGDKDDTAANTTSAATNAVRATDAVAATGDNEVTLVEEVDIADSDKKDDTNDNTPRLAHDMRKRTVARYRSPSKDEHIVEELPASLNATRLIINGKTEQEIVSDSFSCSFDPDGGEIQAASEKKAWVHFRWDELAVVGSYYCTERLGAEIFASRKHAALLIAFRTGTPLRSAVGNIHTSFIKDSFPLLAGHYEDEASEDLDEKTAWAQLIGASRQISESRDCAVLEFDNKKWVRAQRALLEQHRDNGAFKSVFEKILRTNDVEKVVRRATLPRNANHDADRDYHGYRAAPRKVEENSYEKFIAQRYQQDIEGYYASNLRGMRPVQLTALGDTETSRRKTRMWINEDIRAQALAESPEEDAAEKIATVDKDDKILKGLIQKTESRPINVMEEVRRAMDEPELMAVEPDDHDTIDEPESSAELHSTPPNRLGEELCGVNEAETTLETAAVTTSEYRNGDANIADAPLLSNSSTEPSGRLLSDGRALVYPHKGRDATTVQRKDVDTLESNTFLNDVMIDFYMKWIRETVIKDNVQDFIFMSSFFATKIIGICEGTEVEDPEKLDSQMNRLRRWLHIAGGGSNDALWKTRFLVVPINHNLHWTLAILVNPAGMLPKSHPQCDLAAADNGGARLVMMNSLGNYTSENISSALVTFFESEVNCSGTRVEEHSTSTRIKPNITVQSPSLPQQENSCDCGLFILEYAYQFCRSLHVGPISAESAITFIDKLDSDWFPALDLGVKKRGEIRRLIRKLCVTRPELLLYPGIPTSSTYAGARSSMVATALQPLLQGNKKYSLEHCGRLLLPGDDTGEIDDHFYPKLKRKKAATVADSRLAR